MSNRVEKFINMINKRETKMAEHCNGKSWIELCNNSEEQEWYTNNIYPIDKDIVTVANSIIAKFGIPCDTAKTIEDVYSNQWLMRFVKPNNNDQKEDLLKI